MALRMVNESAADRVYGSRFGVQRLLGKANSCGRWDENQVALEEAPYLLLDFGAVGFLEKQAMNFNLHQKTLILISVPIAFELCFIFLIFKASEELDFYSRKAQRSWQFSTLIYRQLIVVSEVGNALIEMYAQNTPDVTERFQQCIAQLPAIERDVQNLGTDDAPPAVQNFYQGTHQMLNMLSQIGSMDSEELKFNPRSAIRKALLLTNRLHRLSEEFLENESNQFSSQNEVQHQLRRRLIVLVVIGVLESLVLAVILGMIFNRGTTSRLLTISGNIENMRSGKPFSPALLGTDEIQDIDQTFRDMAMEINNLRANELALTANASDTICSINRFGMIQQFNPAALELFGCSSQVLQNQSLYNLIQGAERPQLEAALARALAEQSVQRVELSVQKIDGSLCTVLWSFRWAASEELFYGMGHDISEQKQLELLRQELFDMVSHDIRAPLSSIRLILNLIGSGNFGSLSGEGQDRIAMAEYSLMRLVKLTNNLLTVEKYAKEGIVLDLSRNSVRELVASVAHVLRAQLEQKEIDLTFATTDMYAECDKERVSQVLLNLVDNAIKYTKSGGKITVGADPDGDQVKVWVKDSGRGIPLDKQSIIFERFKQVSKTDETLKKGSGLGLAIAKSVVVAHNGTIGVISEPGAGSTFWFTLPKSITDGEDF